MKKLVLLFITIIVCANLIAQSQSQLFAGSDPYLTKAESSWLNDNLSIDNFDFKNKCIGFFEVEPGSYGIGKYAWSLKKERLASMNFDEKVYKLVSLTNAQKIKTNGYDAFLIIVNKKNKGKLERLNPNELIRNTINQYPRIPTGAGVDTNAVLNNANASFLNELNKVNLSPKKDFDYKGKKIAIFNRDNQTNKTERINIAQYIKRVQKQLDQYGRSNFDFIYYLNEEQKKETNGYDIIIQCQIKKDLPLEYLIEMLK